MPRARLTWSYVWSLHGLTFADLESFHNLQHYVPQLDNGSVTESILALMVELATLSVLLSFLCFFYHILKMYINISHG